MARVPEADLPQYWEALEEMVRSFLLELLALTAGEFQEDEQCSLILSLYRYMGTRKNYCFSWKS